MFSFEKNGCRACLGSNRRLYDIKNTPLQGIFEAVTGAELISEGQSDVCYLCTARLQSIGRFQDMVSQADELKQALSKDVKLPSLSMASFVTTPVDHLSLPLASAHSTGTVSVKIEPLDVEVKQEVEEVNMTDNSSEEDFTCPEELIMTAAQSPTPDQCFKPEPTVYHCSVCRKESPSLEQLTQHERSHGIDTCEMCGAKYPTNKRNNHIRKHTKPYKCHICLRSFSEQSSLKKHVATHSSARPFVCQTCNKGFKHKSILMVHIRSHTGERPFTCKLCPKTFNQRTQLKCHMETHKEPEQRAANTKRLTCDTCAITFTLRSSLVRHIKLHSGVKPYGCEVCSKVFAVPGTLACHMRCHTGEKPFVCHVCGKAYAAKANYRKHLKSHQVDSESK